MIAGGCPGGPGRHCGSGRCRQWGARGAVAGAEGVAFGALVLVAGALLLVNAWAVVDTRTALDSAAREYLRAYTEADSAAAAAVAGDRAVGLVLGGRHTLSSTLTVDAPSPASFGPCAPAAVTLAVTVPAIRMPFVDGFGDHRVSVRHVELIDAHREMATGADYDPEATACAD